MGVLHSSGQASLCEPDRRGSCDCSHDSKTGVSEVGDEIDDLTKPVSVDADTVKTDPTRERYGLQYESGCDREWLSPLAAARSRVRAERPCRGDTARG